MRVAYFPKSCAQNSGPVMQAVLQALRQHGHIPVEDDMNADAAVIWSVLWAGRMQANQSIWKHYRNHCRPVVVVDVGALYRGETWKIALNSITTQGYYGHQENLDWDRPRKLGISLAINVSKNPRIVIAAQHSHSLQVDALTSIEDWILQQVQQLKQHTDRPMVVRAHPRSLLRLSQEQLQTHNLHMEKPIKIANTYDNYNLAFDCHAMINYNSGPGTQAALAGTRPIVDSSSLAWPVSIRYQDIEQPYDIDRNQWLVEICHTEYTTEEIQQGTWITRLKL